MAVFILIKEKSYLIETDFILYIALQYPKVRYPSFLRLNYPHLTRLQVPIFIS